MQIYLHFYLRSFVCICKIFLFVIFPTNFTQLLQLKTTKVWPKRRRIRVSLMNPVCHCLGIIVTNLLQIYLNKFIFCVTLRWMDGSQLLFQSWQENQPDFKNFDENCAFMTYHNGECTEIRFSFTEIHTSGITQW